MKKINLNQRFYFTCELCGKEISNLDNASVLARNRNSNGELVGEIISVHNGLCCEPYVVVEGYREKENLRSWLAKYNRAIPFKIGKKFVSDNNLQN